MWAEVRPILNEFVHTPGFLEIIGLLLVFGMIVGAWVQDRRYTFWNFTIIMLSIFMFSEVLRRVFLSAQGAPPSLRPLLLSLFVVVTVVVGMGIGVLAVRRGRQPFADENEELKRLLDKLIGELKRKNEAAAEQMDDG